MAATALIKITQGTLTDVPGVSVLGTLENGEVSVTNGDNTGVARWEITLLDVPPGSTIPTGVIGGEESGTPSANFGPPDVTGSYRICLKVWDSDDNLDMDIRCFAVPLSATGVILPPYQGDPPPIPSHLKPNELNFEGQSRGWTGDNDVRLMHYGLSQIDRLTPLGGEDDPSGTISAYPGTIYIRQTEGNSEVYLNVSPTSPGTVWQRVTSSALAAYFTGHRAVQAVEDSPGWHVLGGFHLDHSVTCRLEALGQVSAEGLTLRVRLWDTQDLQVVGDPVQITSTYLMRSLGSQISLEGGRTYQIQAECVGGDSEAEFGVVPSVALLAPALLGGPSGGGGSARTQLLAMAPSEATPISRWGTDLMSISFDYEPGTPLSASWSLQVGRKSDGTGSTFEVRLYLDGLAQPWPLSHWKFDMLSGDPAHSITFQGSTPILAQLLPGQAISAGPHVLTLSASSDTGEIYVLSEGDANVPGSGYGETSILCLEMG